MLKLSKLEAVKLEVGGSLRAKIQLSQGSPSGGRGFWLSYWVCGTLIFPSFVAVGVCGLKEQIVVGDFSNGLRKTRLSWLEILLVLPEKGSRQED
ncbi:hypothetical protein O6P43_023970 [Quillaja saponaria]|uniref:Uncharacterized protein n=1 Tax=Quillaja saponaria TaxID=32244 RepID=A0AAD7PK07_QUISA|nr:hypothetical protein O6P43_023970 [Quillaja saponaria]